MSERKMPEAWWLIPAMIGGAVLWLWIGGGAVMDAPERIWAWRKTEQLSPDHVRMSYHWIGGQIPEPKHDGTDFLAGYVRADLAPDAALVAELVEALELADAALSGANMDMKHVWRKIKSALANAKLEGKANG